MHRFKVCEQCLYKFNHVLDKIDCKIEHYSIDRFIERINLEDFCFYKEIMY